MDKIKALRSFVDRRPAVLGAYGYGSGVFRQQGYKKEDTPQIDVILLVDDLKEWHIMNLEMNPKDYPLLGKAHINLSSISRLKGHNGINYYSQIVENGNQFKYGIMEEQDFFSDLMTWEHFFVAGRFQKPTLEIKGNDLERDVINYNRRHAVLVASLLSPEITNRKELFKIICNLSYIGALRMNVAENPNKINNIVSGCYDRLSNIYSFNVDYIEQLNNDVMFIDHSKALMHVGDLPIYMVAFLEESGFDLTSLDEVRAGIKKFLSEKNRKEEIHQSLDGIRTNGLIRSVPYALAKVKKRIINK